MNSASRIRLPNCFGDHDSKHEMIYGGVSILMTLHSTDKRSISLIITKWNEEINIEHSIVSCAKSVDTFPKNVCKIHESITFIHIEDTCAWSQRNVFYFRWFFKRCWDTFKSISSVMVKIPSNWTRDRATLNRLHFPFQSILKTNGILCIFWTARAIFLSSNVYFKINICSAHMKIKTSAWSEIDECKAARLFHLHLLVELKTNNSTNQY